MAGKRQAEGPVVEESSGNVFADLGIENPEEELAKASLAIHIRRLISARKLTLAKAAAAMGVKTAEAAAVLDGWLDDLSVDRLIRMLAELGADVEITVRDPAEKQRGRGRVTVIGDAA